LKRIKRNQLSDLLKFQEVTGWKSKIPLGQAYRDLPDYSR